MIDKFIKEYYDYTFYSSSVRTQEYITFERKYKNIIKKISDDIDYELYSFNKRHFEFSAILRNNKNGKFYYLSISDVRFFKNEWCNNILIRTMKHDKDYSGGVNHHCNLKSLKEELIKLDLNNKEV